MTLKEIKIFSSAIFSNNEVVFYSGLKDLANKINYYKSNESSRIKIAKNGRRKYFDLFECQKVANYIISKSFDRDIPKVLKWMDWLNEKDKFKNYKS